MFFTLILENRGGDRVNMTTTANQYMTSQIEGLNPPPGTISISGYAGMDGSFNIADVILLQKCLSSVPNAELKDWRSCDLDRNGKLNAID